MTAAVRERLWSRPRFLPVVAVGRLAVSLEALSRGGQALDFEAAQGLGPARLTADGRLAPARDKRASGGECSSSSCRAKRCSRMNAKRALAGAACARCSRHALQHVAERHPVDAGTRAVAFALGVGAEHVCRGDVEQRRSGRRKHHCLWAGNMAGGLAEYQELVCRLPRPQAPPSSKRQPRPLQVSGAPASEKCTSHFFTAGHGRKCSCWNTAAPHSPRQHGGGALTVCEALGPDLPHGVHKLGALQAGKAQGSFSGGGPSREPALCWDNREVCKARAPPLPPPTRLGGAVVHLLGAALGPGVVGVAEGGGVVCDVDARLISKSGAADAHAALGALQPGGALLRPRRGGKGRQQQAEQQGLQ